MIYDSWWFMMIFDDLWWFMMSYDELWWVMMSYDELWWFMMRYYDLWWVMMIYDEILWFMMSYDDLWLDIMIYDELWWFMMIYDELWWFMIAKVSYSRYSEFLKMLGCCIMTVVSWMTWNGRSLHRGAMSQDRSCEVAGEAIDDSMRWWCMMMYDLSFSLSSHISG